MQFRERRRVIQIIRTVYDPAIKRGRAEVAARLDKDAPALDDRQRTAFSPDELAEIDAFLTGRAAHRSRETMRAAAAGLAAQMRLAEVFFCTGGDGVIAADILTAWEDLKKAMHKAGYRKDKNGR